MATKTFDAQSGGTHSWTLVSGATIGECLNASDDGKYAYHGWESWHNWLGVPITAETNTTSKINSVTYWARGYRSAADAGGMCVFGWLVGGDPFAPLFPNLELSAADYSTSPITVSPKTGLAWTWAEFNAITLQGYNFQQHNMTQYIDHVWLVVDYTPAANHRFFFFGH